MAEYLTQWATREFGPEHAADIADIVSKYTKYNRRRKPELLEPGTFNLVNYQEADRIVGRLESYFRQGRGISAKLPENARDAFFQLVLHPGEGLLHRQRTLCGRGEEQTLRQPGPRQRERFCRPGESAVQGGPGLVGLLQPHAGRRQMESHDGPDAHRLLQLAATTAQRDAHSHRG